VAEQSLRVAEDKNEVRPATPVTGLFYEWKETVTTAAWSKQHCDAIQKRGIPDSDSASSLTAEKNLRQSCDPKIAVSLSQTSTAFSICHKKRTAKIVCCLTLKKGNVTAGGLDGLFASRSFRMLFGLEHFHQRLLQNEDAPSDSHGRQLA